MKYLLFLFFLILYVCFPTKAQQIELFKTYFSNSELRLSNVDTTHDGGYILCGRSSNINGGDFFLLKTDSDGNEVWHLENNLFDGTHFDNNSYAVRETADHTFILVGNLMDSNFIQKTYVIKVDSLGTIKWSRKYKIGINSESAYDIRIISNNEYLIYGALDNNAYYLLKLDSQGDTVGLKVINISPLIPKASSNEIYEYNGGLIFFTNVIDSTIIFHGNLYNQYVIVMQFDSQLNMISSHSYSDTIPINVFGKKFIDSVNYYLLTSANSWFTNYEMLVSSDTSGTIFNSCVLPEPVTAIGCLGNNLAVYFSLGIGDDACIVRYNSNCDSNWAVCKSLTNIMAPRYVGYDARTNDVIALGVIDNGSQTYALSYLMRINDSLLDEVPELQKQFNVQVSPNPLIDESELIIFNSSRQVNDYEINIYSTNGKLVQQHNLKGTNKIKLFKKDFKFGTYYFTVYTGEKKVSSGRFIVN